MEQKEARSCGVIPIFKDGGTYKILIVKNTRGGHWGLPKGTPENNETPLETATRELYEETGIKDNIQIQAEPIFIEKYLFEQDSVKYSKTVTYYIGIVNEMIIGSNLDEIMEAKWVSTEESKNFIDRTSTLELINELEDYLSI